MNLTKLSKSDLINLVNHYESIINLIARRDKIDYPQTVDNSGGDDFNSADNHKNSGDAIFLSAEGDTLYANEAGMKFIETKFEIEELGASESGGKSAIPLIKKDENPNRAEKKILKFSSPEGEQTSIEIKPLPIDWNEGNYLQEFIKAVSSDKIIGNKTKITEAEYYAFIDNFHEMVLIASGGKIKYFNRMFGRITGYSKSDLIDKSILSIIFQEDREKAPERFTGENNLPNKSLEFRLIKKDNSIIWVKNRIITAGWENAPSELYFIQDITAEKQVKLEYKKLSAGISQSQQLVVITDSEGIIEYVNDFFSKLTGYSAEEALGSRMSICKSGFHSDEYYSTMWKIIKSGEVWKGELMNKRKDGTLYWTLATISPIYNENGEIINFISIQIDITRRKNTEKELEKAKEEAEKAEKVKSEFLAQISHEIRTPVNTLLSFAQLLEVEIGTKIAEENQDIFGSIKRAGDRIIRTIDLILNSAQVQSGTYDFRPVTVNLENVVNDVVSKRKTFAEDKKLFFNFINNSDNPVLEADIYALEQIFTNLLDNAIKFTAEGGIEVKLSEDGDNIIVEFKDTGVGINEEYMRDLFKPFSQEEQGYTRSFDGNGLGLSLVKKFCDLHNAEIKVKSVKNKGTTFSVIFSKKKSGLRPA